MKPLKDDEVSFFCGQMFLSVKSGISVLEALDIMAEDAEEEEAKILQEVKTYMLECGSLAAAAGKTKLFPPYCVQMLHIGEKTGSMEDVLHGLTDYYRREEQIQSGITDAVLYPALMSSAMAAIMAILLTKVMPVFEAVFEQFGTQMTGMAGILLHIGSAMERYALAFTAVFAAGLLLLLWLARGKPAWKVRGRVLDHIGPIRSFRYGTDVCRFTGILSIAVKSGVQAGEIFPMVEEAGQTARFQERLKECMKTLSSGNTLGTALRQCGIFHGQYLRMLSIGDRTGSLDTVLSEISDAYEDQLAEWVNKKISMVEPVFFTFLAVQVAAILFSVMLPLLAVISSM